MSGEITLDEARRLHSAAKLRLSLHCATIETSLAREDPLVAELNTLSADFGRREQQLEQAVYHLTSLLATNEESNTLQRDYMAFISESKRVYYQLQGRLTALIAAAEATTVSDAITSIWRRTPNHGATCKPASPTGHDAGHAPTPSDGAPHPGHDGMACWYTSEDPQQPVLPRTHAAAASLGPHTQNKETSNIQLPPFTCRFLTVVTSMILQCFENSHSLQPKLPHQQGSKPPQEEPKGAAAARITLGESNDPARSAVASGNSYCPFHKVQGHNSRDCKWLKSLDIRGRRNLLKRKELCFRCFGAHLAKNCDKVCAKCGREHHQMLCQGAQQPPSNAQGYGSQGAMPLPSQPPPPPLGMHGQASAGLSHGDANPSPTASLLNTGNKENPAL